MPKTSLQTNHPSPLEDLLAVAEWPEAQAEEIRDLERATRSHRLFASLNTPARRELNCHTLLREESREEGVLLSDEPAAARGNPRDKSPVAQNAGGP